MGTAALLSACGIKSTAGAGGSAGTTSAATTSGTAGPGTALASGAGTSSAGMSPAGMSPAGASSAGMSSAGASAAGGPSSAASSAAADRTAVGRHLNWSNWTTYIDVDAKDKNRHPTLDAFTARTGISVTYTEDINDNTQYFGKIQPQLAGGHAIGADVIVLTDWMVDKMIRLGYAQPLDHAAIPNLKNLDPALLNVDFDPGRRYSVTWQSGMTGIMSNPKLTGGKPVTSITRLLTDSSLKGRVALLTELPDTVGLVLLALGFDPGHFTDAQFGQAIAMVQKAVDAGQIRSFTGNDYTQGLASGDLAACLGWSGDAVQLLSDQPGLQFTLPDSGGMRWSDNLLVPVYGQHRAGVEQLINFYLEPANAAAVADTVNFVCPVPSAKAVLARTDKDVADNPLVFPDAATVARLHTFMSLDDAQYTRYHKVFDELAGA